MRLSFAAVAVALLCLARASQAERVRYVAAVVEMDTQGTTNTTVPVSLARQLMLANVAAAEEAASQAVAGGAQVIVFSEYTLMLPDAPRDVLRNFSEPVPAVAPGAPSPTLCGDARFADRPVLQALSCMAKKLAVYVVVDVADVQPCPGAAPGGCAPASCRADRVSLYNTAVAFSPSGAVVARYHKQNLYFEPEFDTPAACEGVSAFFAPDLRVTFGLSICFDIMFSAPILALPAVGVRDVLFPSYWENFTPVLTAAQVQAAWARFAGANLVAASSAVSGWDSSGSGVYSGSDAASGPALRCRSHSTTSLKEQSTVVVGVVETDASNSSAAVHAVAAAPPMAPQSHQGAKLPFDITTRAFLAAPGAVGSLTASAGTVSCTVEYRVAAAAAAGGGDDGARAEPAAAAEQYVLLVASGFYHGLFRADLCMLVRCDRNDSSCMDRGGLVANTAFAGVNVTASFAPVPAAASGSDGGNTSLPAEGLQVLASTDAGLPLCHEAVRRQEEAQEGGAQLVTLAYSTSAELPSRGLAGDGDELMPPCGCEQGWQQTPVLALGHFRRLYNVHGG